MSHLRLHDHSLASMVARLLPIVLLGLSWQVQFESLQHKVREDPRGSNKHVQRISTIGSLLSDGRLSPLIIGQDKLEGPLPEIRHGEQG